MEVRPGYKLTDIGVLPEDWDVKQLHQISPKQSVGLVINPSTYFDARGTIPMLVGSNVGENKIDWIHAKRISINSHKRLPASTIYADDLVTVRVGEPGTTAVIPQEFDSSNCASMMIVRRGPSFDSTWLCHMMNSKHGRSQIEGVQYGTAQKQFNISDAVNFQYPVPPLSEQRAIATALSDVDGLLDGLTRLIAKKRDLKQATMQQLLTGQTRLPGFSGAWEVKTLADVVERFIGGGTPSRANPEFWGGEIPWVTVKDFATFDPFQAQESITKLGLLNSAANLIPAGTLITSTRMALGKAVAYKVDVAINQDLKALIVKQRVTVNFLLHWFTQNGERIDALGGGSTVKGISVGELKRLPILLPDITEQTAIATILSDMDAELAALEARLEKTRALKQAMMSELLTGKTRLPT